jgi:serine/threonine protein kinase
MASSDPLPEICRSKYQVIGLVGQGQFGRVFCAVERQTSELVALKELDRLRFSTRQFLRELDFLTSLKHPNIVGFHTLEYGPTGRYLVMDYCEGGTLRDLIESSSKLSLKQCLTLMIDIVLGLQYAHQNDVIHCDLKPENILLRLNPTGWTAHISDFGIARLQREANSTTLTGLGDTGSPAYMAPERFYGKYSFSSDLYALGVILFELIVGQRPFSGRPKELMAAHLNQPVVIPETVPFFLRSVITTALQKLPQNRFLNASQLLTSLQTALLVLEATQEDSPYLPPQMTYESGVAMPVLWQESLDETVTRIAIASHQIYVSQSTQVQRRIYDHPSLGGIPVYDQLQFDQPVVTLHPHACGCFVTTRSQPNSSQTSLYTLHSILSDSAASTTLQNFPDSIVSAEQPLISVSPQGDWSAIVHTRPALQNLLEESINFDIYRISPELKKIGTFICDLFPLQVIILNQRYGLILSNSLDVGYSKAIGATLHLFNRRGQRMGQLSLNAPVRQVFHHWTLPNPLLAIAEDGQEPGGLLIRLIPYQVQRIALPFNPDFVEATDWGYILANTQGQMGLLNLQGELITQLELRSALNIDAELRVSAIAPFHHSGLLLATGTEHHSLLWAIDLQTLIGPIPR